MPKQTTRAPRSRRTKAEMQEEFAQLVKETESEEAKDPKVEEQARLHATEVMHAVEGASVEQVVQKIAAVSLEASRALGSVSEQLMAQVHQLEVLREAAALEREEIARIHRIDVAATALDQLVAEHQARREQLEAEQALAKAAWEEDEGRREQARKEQEDATRKAREREAEEYEYKKAQERKKAQDKFDEQMQKLEKQNRERQESLEKGWQQREAALKASDEELAGLRRQAAEFPARLAQEVESAVVAAVEQARRQHETELRLIKKDVESDQKVAVLQVKALEDQVAKQAVQLADLQQQLQLAKQQVQEIAVKALDSAAGAKTLEEVRQIAREQAKRERT